MCAQPPGSVHRVVGSACWGVRAQPHGTLAGVVGSACCGWVSRGQRSKVKPTSRGLPWTGGLPKPVRPGDKRPQLGEQACVCGRVYASNSAHSILPALGAVCDPHRPRNMHTGWAKWFQGLTFDPWRTSRGLSPSADPAKTHCAWGNLFQAVGFEPASTNPLWVLG